MRRRIIGDITSTLKSPHFLRRKLAIFSPVKTLVLRHRQVSDFLDKQALLGKAGIIGLRR
ncbi:hypothetical protein ES708_13156 [subsurface metagenome]